MDLIRRKEKSREKLALQTSLEEGDVVWNTMSMVVWKRCDLFVFLLHIYISLDSAFYELSHIKTAFIE